jgi:hypothetical protein
MRMARHFRSGSSCDPDSATLDCRTFLSSSRSRLALKLAFLCPKEVVQCGAERATKKLKITETTNQEVSTAAGVV